MTWLKDALTALAMVLVAAVTARGSQKAKKVEGQMKVAEATNPSYALLLDQIKAEREEARQRDERLNRLETEVDKLRERVRTLEDERDQLRDDNALLQRQIVAGERERQELRDYAKVLWGHLEAHAPEGVRAMIRRPGWVDHDTLS